MKRPSSSTMADSPELPPPAPSFHRKKKTRELPNLSDCHCCNLRINCTNPKNRLQILASEWRIVLLCKCCYNLVESSKYCSYCLTRVSNACYHECKRCHRRIHKQCASMFSFGSGKKCGSDDFSVCFDCWLPKLIENEYSARFMRNTTKKKGVKVCGESMNSLGSSGVCNSQDKEKALEGTVNDAHVVAQKKVAIAVEAEKKALAKEMDAGRAMVLAKSTLGLVSVDKDGDRRGSVVDDDAQLAIRLHRAMNSSPRISRNSCLLNTHCVDVPELNDLESRAAIETSCSGRPTHSRGDEQNWLFESREECEQHCSRARDEMRLGDSGGGGGGGLITYCRKGRAPLEVKNKEEPDCVPSSSNGVWSSGDARTKEGPESSFRTYRRRLTKVKEFKVEPATGHCSKTYRRRHSSIPNFKSKLNYGSCNMDDVTHAQTLSLKCSEESRALTNAS